MPLVRHALCDRLSQPHALCRASPRAQHWRSSESGYGCVNTTMSMLQAHATFGSKASTAQPSAHSSSAADLTNFVEFPAEARNLGQLMTQTLPDEPGRLQFAWLSEAGIFHGRIDVGRPEVPPSALEYLPHRGLLPFPQSLSSSSGGIPQGPNSLTAVVSRPSLSMVVP